MRKRILYYAIKYQGEYHKIKKAIENNEPYIDISYPYPYVTIVDELYPSKFKDLRYPPFIIFYEGDLSLCEKECVSIIGSRIPSDYGMEMCNHITKILKEKYVIVSGLAKGIDGIAHRCAIHHQTIAVIGNGIDICYPKVNQDIQKYMQKHQLVLSEYPRGVSPLKYHFPWRNRLIATLSESLVVVEAKVNSGTMHTVNEALELNKNIYCVPHPMNSIVGKGCNLLISQGANILVDDDDIESI